LKKTTLLGGGIGIIIEKIEKMNIFVIYVIQIMLLKQFNEGKLDRQDGSMKIGNEKQVYNA
jgi:hypothetical protein